MLVLANPGLDGMPFTSSTLWGAIQYLGPRETAPAHRHTAAALRFVLEGSGVFTTVNGDRVDMAAGDLILTPGWDWHDHTNTSDGSMAWFDGLDLPAVYNLDAVFFERFAESMQPLTGSDLSEVTHAEAGVRPTTEEVPLKRQVRYRWERTDRALDALLRESGQCSATIEYIDTRTGGSVLPTIACEAQRLLPGYRTPTRRHAGSRICVVYEGSGIAVIGGKRFDWERGDVFVAPSWAAIDLESHTPSSLFWMTDRPLLQALGLYRQHQAEQHQVIEATFEPT
ncbi:cupin domain-containing protein [Amycolatopsis pithecellobii]|uniref:cupin domain-containing protein n=1 Tax=Amycolatopsis pithecellobii TaxID=664692 RepID=UPI001AA04AC2|nr:cupin domain-containing protein [Amycolatopsis pithecellobii]